MRLLFLSLFLVLEVQSQTNIPARIFPEHITPTGYVSVAVMPDGKRTETGMRWNDRPVFNGEQIDSIKYESNYPENMIVHYYREGLLIGSSTNNCYRLDIDQQLASVSTQRTLYVATYVDTISGRTNVMMIQRPRSEIVAPSVRTYLKPEAKTILSKSDRDVIFKSYQVTTQRMDRSKSVAGFKTIDGGKKTVTRFADGHSLTSSVKRVRGFAPVDRAGTTSARKVKK